MGLAPLGSLPWEANTSLLPWHVAEAAAQKMRDMRDATERSEEGKQF